MKIITIEFTEQEARVVYFALKRSAETKLLETELNAFPKETTEMAHNIAVRVHAQLKKERVL